MMQRAVEGALPGRRRSRRSPRCGGASSLRARFVAGPWAAVRRRRSIEPPWVPRCLRLRLFLVCAMESNLATDRRCGSAPRSRRGRGRIPAMARRPGKPASAASGTSPTISAATTRPPCGSASSERGRRLRQRHRRPGRGRWSRSGCASPKLERDRPDAGRPPPDSRSAAAIARGLGERHALELHVEGGQRRAGGDERRARGRVRLGRAEVGLELARAPCARRARRARRCGSRRARGARARDASSP